MPYDKNSDLPQAVRDNYKERCQTVFREAFNADYKRNKNESRAFAVANVAAKNCEQYTDGNPANGETKNPDPNK
jgi:cation transport regulator ChaB